MRIQVGKAWGLGIVASLLSTTVLAKPSIKPQMPLSMTMDSRPVPQYPPLPQEILNRASNKMALSATEAAAFRPKQDWALASIGLFDVLAPLMKQSSPPGKVCGEDVVVAVIDTGIDYRHKDLMDSVWVNPGEVGPWEPPAAMKDLIACRDKSCNGIDDDNNGFEDDVTGYNFVHNVPLPFDTHGHGSHVSGIIATTSLVGPTQNILCPNVKIMALKYYDSSGSGYNNLNNTVRAIHYAINNGAQIINYSGGGHDSAPAERAAIEEAQRKGILFVAAAGNDGHNNEANPYYPASYPLDNIVGVASVNEKGQLLPSSNFGKTVPLAAPGFSILSTLPENRYGTMSGTSQATAFVTGAAALLVREMRAKNQTFDYTKVRNWLVEGAKPLPGKAAKNLLSAGLLNLPRSLSAEKESFTKKSTPAIAASPSKAKRFR